MPLGVQIIAPPFREDLCFRAGWKLERSGAVYAPIASHGRTEAWADEETTSHSDHLQVG